MEKQICNSADHQAGQFSNINIPGTPNDTLLSYNSKDLSTTSLNFVTTPTRLTTSETSLVTLGDSQEIQSNTITTDISKPIYFISPRISSPTVESEAVIAPMTPKTHVDKMDLSPSPTLFSPKINRSLPPSMPLGGSLFHDDDDDDDFNDHFLSCRPISNGFQTRLNCALMNLQHGYFENTLTDFEDCSYPHGKHHRDDYDSASSAPLFDSSTGTDKKKRYDLDGSKSFNISPRNDRSPKQIMIPQKKRC